MKRKFERPKKRPLRMSKVISVLKQPSQIAATLKSGREHKAISESEVNNLQKLIADIATGVWRMRNKFSMVNIEDLPDEMKKANRHLESVWDALASAKVETRDHTSEKYVPGMALKVIAFQPTPHVQAERITETIKPSVFYKDTLIQVGEVIVATPDTTELKNNANIENAAENKQGNTE